MKIHFASAAIALAASVATAQDYPSKPVTFVVPFAAGSATDQLARGVGQAMYEATIKDWCRGDRNVSAAMATKIRGVELAPVGATRRRNPPTISTSEMKAFIGASAVLLTAAYTCIRCGKIKPHAYLMIAGLFSSAAFLTCYLIYHYNVPAKSVGEFIALAKKQPGKYTFGSGSSSSRIAGELFQQMAGVQLVHVPYKSNPLAVTDLLGGQIDMMITDTTTGLPQVKGGKVRALGVSSLKRSPLAPDVPTIDEAGVKGYEMGYWFAAYVPSKTPPAVVAKLHDLLVAATKGAAARMFYETSGTDPVISTPQELAKFQAAESQKWGRIIKAANIQPE